MSDSFEEGRAAAKAHAAAVLGLPEATGSRYEAAVVLACSNVTIEAARQILAAMHAEPVTETEAIQASWAMALKRQ